MVIVGELKTEALAMNPSYSAMALISTPGMSRFSTPKTARGLLTLLIGTSFLKTTRPGGADPFRRRPASPASSGTSN